VVGHEPPDHKSTGAGSEAALTGRNWALPSGAVALASAHRTMRPHIKLGPRKRACLSMRPSLSPVPAVDPMTPDRLV
jgi:hypothetical protein